MFFIETKAEICYIENMSIGTLLYETGLILFETFVAFVFMFLIVNTTDWIVKDINKKWQWTIFFTVIISMVIFVLNIGFHWLSFICPLLAGYLVYKIFN
jgi:hypothetical protein